MVLSAGADFLNSFFAGFDKLFLSFYHSICCSPLTILSKLITFIGEKGLVFFIAALILMCFSKTRRTGICLFGAVACGALITNIILKDLIARPRPFMFEPYSEWYLAVGAPFEDDFSFPSGHVTAAAAGMMALRLRNGKKWTVPAIIWVLLTCMARNYLMAHYPSDVLFGALIGIVSAVIAYFITELIFRILRVNRRKPWAEFILNWSLPDFGGIPSKLGLISEAEEPVRSVRAGKTSSRASTGYVGKHSR
ncbi:MAG: phosphatase PAP2 family protein [Eubacteriales bacterium]|nr:phosphatase PAP2 family protein [Eubacteriales bacterium]